ncbi:MAG: hypothetical protein ACYCUX_03240 [Metallibacterium sp.]
MPSSIAGPLLTSLLSGLRDLGLGVTTIAGIAGIGAAFAAFAAFAARVG